MALKGKDGKIIYKRKDLTSILRREYQKVLGLKVNEDLAWKICHVTLMCVFELAKSVKEMLSLPGIGTFFTEDSSRVRQMGRRDSLLLKYELSSRIRTIINDGGSFLSRTFVMSEEEKRLAEAERENAEVMEEEPPGEKSVGEESHAPLAEKEESEKFSEKEKPKKKGKEGKEGDKKKPEEEEQGEKERDETSENNEPEIRDLVDEIEPSSREDEFEEDDIDLLDEDDDLLGFDL